MGTLNTAFNIAAGALEADQAALGIVANNTANANTPGYTRQVANWQENPTITLSGSAYGTGVTMTGATSQRDRVLEQSMQQQTQIESASSERLSALNQVQSIFNASTSGATTGSAQEDIGSQMQQFFDALSQLESSPADPSLRQQVMSAAATMADSFNSAASQLSAQQSSLDAQSAGIVSQVNSLSSAIAGLNTQIQQTSPNGDAGALEDQRQQDLTQLSQLVGISQITTENNGLTITTTSGALLVSEGKSYPLTTGLSGGLTHIYDSNGNDVTSELDSGGGQLGGLLMVRDQDVPQVQSSLDQLAYSLGTQLNAANEAGSDANGNTGRAIFSLPATAAGAAAGISVSLTDSAQIAAAGAGLGASNDSNLLQMVSLQDSNIVGGTSPSTYYSGLVTSVGSLVSAVGTENTAQQASLTQLSDQINSLSSVNLNEEAVSMQNLEQAYQAASKVFTILDQVMTSAINLGVPTAVS